MFPNDLSYDPRDPRCAVAGLPGVELAVQVFTVDNVYGLDPAAVRVEELEGGAARIVASGLSWAGQQQRSAGAVAVTMRPDPDVVGACTISVAARHADPIKSVKLVFRGLPAAALDGGWWQATSPPGVTRPVGPFNPLLWRYPWPADDPWPEWETPWAAAGREGGASAVTLAVRDAEVRPVRLFAHCPPWAGGATVVEVVCEQDARRWGEELQTPPVRVRVIDHDDATAVALTDLADHVDWVAAAKGLVDWESRADVPEWMRGIRLVVTLHGCHWTGYTFNTFDGMADALATITQWIPGDEVLAYLPGWEGRYYHDYPWYRPGSLLGGAEGFARLVQRAHALGVRVMPMFGIHGVNVRQYPQWELSVLRTRSGRMPALVNKPDWDGDRAGEDDQVFCNPAEPAFHEHLLEQVSAVVAELGVDGVFLDTSACWFNDPRWNLVEGYRSLAEALRGRHPGLLVAGEGWFDALLGIFPVNQSWHGVDRRFRAPELLARFGRALGHLSTGAPGSGSTGVHEGGFGLPGDVVDPAPGHLPVVGIVDDTLDRFADVVERICRAAATP